MRYVAGTVGLVVAVGVAAAQTPPPKPLDAAPAFEVASVKPSNAAQNSAMFMTEPPGRFTATNIPLRMLIQGAYREVVRFSSQLEGGPGWISSARFDIAAKAPDGAPPEQTPLMLRSLLAERFKLKVHTETRETPVFEMVRARSDGSLGPRLSRTAVDCAAIRDARLRGRGQDPPQPPVPPRVDERPVCTTRLMGRSVAGGGIALILSAGGMTMEALAGLITSYAGRVVVDRTGLTGEFDMSLEFAPPRPLSTNPTGDLAPLDEGPTVFVALQEQLGLELESQRGPVEYLVIDSVEQPTPD